MLVGMFQEEPPCLNVLGKIAVRMYHKGDERIKIKKNKLKQNNNNKN